MNRQPKGIPVGGQFAAGARAESDIVLAHQGANIEQSDRTWADHLDTLGDEVRWSSAECPSIGEHDTTLVTAIDPSGKITGTLEREVYLNDQGVQPGDEDLIESYARDNGMEVVHLNIESGYATFRNVEHLDLTDAKPSDLADELDRIDDGGWFRDDAEIGIEEHLDRERRAAETTFSGIGATSENVPAAHFSG